MTDEEIREKIDQLLRDTDTLLDHIWINDKTDSWGTEKCVFTQNEGMALMDDWFKDLSGQEKQTARERAWAELSSAADWLAEHQPGLRRQKDLLIRLREEVGEHVLQHTAAFWHELKEWEDALDVAIGQVGE